MKHLKTFNEAVATKDKTSDEVKKEYLRQESDEKKRLARIFAEQEAENKKILDRGDKESSYKNFNFEEPKKATRVTSFEDYTKDFKRIESRQKRELDRVQKEERERVEDIFDDQRDDELRMMKRGDRETKGKVLSSSPNIPNRTNVTTSSLPREEEGLKINPVDIGTFNRLIRNKKIVSVPYGSEASFIWIYRDGRKVYFKII